MVNYAYYVGIIMFSRYLSDFSCSKDLAESFSKAQRDNTMRTGIIYCNRSSHVGGNKNKKEREREAGRTQKEQGMRVWKHT